MYAGNILKIITGSIFNLCAKLYAKRDMYVWSIESYYISNKLSEIQNTVPENNLWIL